MDLGKALDEISAISFWYMCYISLVIQANITIFVRVDARVNHFHANRLLQSIEKQNIMNSDLFIFNQQYLFVFK